MTTEARANLAASVRQRLLNKARELDRPFNEVLQRFAIERFINRLSRSRHAARFILKGALLLPVWAGPASRPTMDIDLLGRTRNDPTLIVAAMRDICVAEAEDDGMSYDPTTVVATSITEDAEYEGVRVHIRGTLGTALVTLKVDIGFGDVVIPGPARISYPTVLDFPPPELTGYTMESTIAEKLQAMVRFGYINSRMKDFYDIWMLSRDFDFSGETLSEAIR